ncbi:MAG TPA: hypothetical protein VHP37_26055 [Burkholderiales bacterium]|nr:hypothetical protein [Burkholderiales bacterium]
MKSSFYSGMLNGLSKVNLSGFERAQAELHMRRAAAIVETLLGSRQAGQVEKAETPVADEEYRAAA